MHFVILYQIHHLKNKDIVQCINTFNLIISGLLLGKIDKKKAILTFSGYADKTASEKKMVRNVRSEGDCYFNTGDVLVMDHYGYFYFKDRTGDTFKYALYFLLHPGTSYISMFLQLSDIRFNNY